jgi:hypothetical protein
MPDSGGRRLEAMPRELVAEHPPLPASRRRRLPVLRRARRTPRSAAPPGALVHFDGTKLTVTQMRRPPLPARASLRTTRREAAARSVGPVVLDAGELVGAGLA